LAALLAFVRWPVAWDALGEMETFAEHFLRRRFSAELAERGRMAANELLENACRYAIAGGEVALEVRDAGSGFEIRVTNDAVESRVAILRKRIDEIAGDDGHDAYKRALRKLMNEPEGAVSSGLGLLRARQEAGVGIALEVNGKQVTVIATSNVAVQARKRAEWGKVR
jgi:hypothetical protein